MPELFVASERKRLLSIDVLRGLAALAVVLAHIPHSHGNAVGATFWAMLPLDFGSIGVPLFIVLSGFCIHSSRARAMAAGESPQTKWFPFWKRRFVRLYPPYVASMLFCFAVLAFLNPSETLASLNDLRNWGGDLLSHLGMFHNLTRNYWDGMGNPPFWSLGLEEQLYALFFVMLLLRSKRSILGVLKISLAVTLAWRFSIPLLGWVLSHGAGIPHEQQAVILGPFEFANGAMWPFGWWFLWVLGAVVAEVRYGLITLPAWCTSRRTLLALLVFGLLTHKATLGRFGQFWIRDEGGLSLVRLFIELVVSLSDLAIAAAGMIVMHDWLKREKQAAFRGPVVDGLAWVGTISYSLYLTHYRSINLVERLVPGMDQAGMLVRFLIYIPACLAVAWGFYWLVERHFLGSSVHQKPRAFSPGSPLSALPVQPKSVRRQLAVNSESGVAKIDT
ncbi:MAG: acyltransferase [Gemmataceae bacterium]